ncbi:ABC transporter ATP-binding protein [Nesterenkonia flava]|uniref:ABC transporter ATP-binding protein n=1 Tax=Nesterenkonia flava TaxID=469799 RepID=A0ABU1FQT9_9MICC|nr:ABC transporter ATP-binding protein [Nesterenkonia flava]MDR5710553.1 ABC transporter ATP-binding protein [Nesterenkonia flava]
MTATQTEKRGAVQPDTEPTPGPVLEVKDLRVVFTRHGRQIHAVNGLNYRLHAGQTLAIIGESGSGKSVGVRSLMGLLPPSARVTGSVQLNGQELVGLSEKEFRSVRGREIAMVFQDPATSLNPTMNIGSQIVEAIRLHAPMRKKEAEAKAVELLKLVRLPSPETRVSQFPHQLSGGMRQRVVIAIALASDPKVLIADEATTALDVTTQAQIMELLVDIQERLGTAVIMISHDIGLAANYAHDVMVMYAGKVVEHAETKALFSNVQMPYTKALLGAVPQLTTKPHSKLTVIGGHPPDLSNLPSGCPFAPRCPRATDICVEEEPRLVEHAKRHRYACWHPVNGQALEAGGTKELLEVDAHEPLERDGDHRSDEQRGSTA